MNFYPNIPGPMYMPINMGQSLNDMNNLFNRINEFDNRIKNLEKRIKKLEGITTDNEYTEPDNSLYML